jgi:hypothetical protein
MVKKVVVAPVELGALEEVGAQARVVTVKKSGIRRGWEGASVPGVIDHLKAQDEVRISQIAATLIERAGS